MNEEQKTAPKVEPDRTGEQGTRVDYPRRTLTHEEYAAEFDTIRGQKMQEQRSSQSAADSSADSGRIVGVIGIVLGVLALFMWTIVLGPVSAVLGYFAYSQGKRTLGAWGLALGVIATLSYFILIPFVR